MFCLKDKNGRERKNSNRSRQLRSNWYLTGKIQYERCFYSLPKLQNRHLNTENCQCPTFQSSTMTWGRQLKPFPPALIFMLEVCAGGYWRMCLDTYKEFPSTLYEYKTLLGNSARNDCLSARVADFFPCMFTAILIPLGYIITEETKAVSFPFRPRNFRNSLESSCCSAITGCLFPKLLQREDWHWLHTLGYLANNTRKPLLRVILYLFSLFTSDILKWGKKPQKHN